MKKKVRNDEDLLFAGMQITDGDFSPFWQRSAHFTKAEAEFKGIVCPFPSPLKNL
jgi:hypothetical protein